MKLSKIKGIIAAIIISPFYILFVIGGLLIAGLFALLLRMSVWLGVIDGIIMLFNITNGLLKRFNMRKVKVS